MSLPPVTVRIKRKATDEPVDFLRVQESNGKRQRRAAEFVFSRQLEPVLESSVAVSEGVRRIKPIHKSSSSLATGAHLSPPHVKMQEAAADGSSTKNSSEAPATTTSVQKSTTQNATLSVNQQPRRFHISRDGNKSLLTDSIAGRVQKRTTLFVEYTTRAKPSSSESSSPFTPFLTPDTESAQSQKKPGQAARISTGPATTAMSSTPQLAPEPRNVRLPSGLVAPWSLDDAQLVLEMQAYTLQEIGHNIAVANTTKPGGSPAPAPAPTSTPLKKPSKFKPKIPKLRYHERHPEEFVNPGTTEVNDLIEDMEDDSEYIIDTYIRIPADAMEVDLYEEKNIGFLVLDGQSEIDEFYSGETDSDDDEDYDEEDENAENHYTADYPDEEVDSSDEYGRNPYQYASDDATFSDDSDEGHRHPMGKKPAWLRKAEGSNEDEDDKDGWR